MKSFPVFVSFLIITLCFGNNLYSAIDVPAGPVQGAWTKVNSPYNINGDIRIDTTKSLTIEPGVVVNFIGRYKFTIFGSLQAVGNQTDTIKFTSPDPGTPWKGMLFESTYNNGLDSSRFAYCIIEHGRPENKGGFTGAGGAIYCYYSPDIAIRNCVIRNNYAENNGGGIMLRYSSNIYITNTTLENNACYYNGAGICCYFESNPKLVNVLIQNNRAGQFGGAMFTFGNSKPQLVNCLIVGNLAMEAGGGFYLRDSTPVFSPVNRCSMTGNRAPCGSELYSEQAAHIILNMFPLASPTPFLAYPDSNFSFDILSALFTRRDADLYVSPSGDDSNDGLSEGSPLRTIQHAQRILGCDASNPRTIFLDAGTYSKAATGELFPLYGIPGMTIQGDGRLTTILDGNRQGNILTCYASSMFTLKSMILQNGLQEGGKGGAVYIEQCNTIVLNDMLIQNNEARQGGGIRINGDNCRIEDVEISNNDASMGGGIFADGGSVTLDNVVFEKDSASAYGGAIYFLHSQMKMEKTNFSENYSLYDGGGIYSHYGKIMVSDFTFDNNYAGRSAGGIWSKNLQAGSEIQNGILKNNEAVSHAGALYFESCGDLKLEKLLIHNNTAGFAGGIYAPSSHTIDFNQITVADNTSGSGFGIIYLSNSNQNISFQNSILRNNIPVHFSNPPSTVTYSNIEGASGYGYFGTGCIDADPLFVNSTGGDYTLSWNSYPLTDGNKSPCIDSGDPDPAANDPDGTPADMGYWSYFQSVDFRTKNLVASAKVSSDSLIILDYTIENLGDVAAYPDTTILYLSEDVFLSEDDSILKYSPTEIIDAAAELSYTDTVRVAGGLEAGNWYFLIVADGFNRVTETDELNNIDSVMIGIQQSPKITLQTESSTVCLDDSTGFSVEAIGTEPLSYQWWKNGMMLDDSVRADLSIPAATLADTGSYFCIVSNEVGTISSEIDTLIVNLPAGFTTMLDDGQYCVHDTVAFTVEGTGTLPLDYQWYKDGQLLTDSTGTVNTLSGIGTAESGNYLCTVINSCGSDSNSAVLIVHALPEPQLGNDSSICRGSSIDLDPGLFVSYDWTPAYTQRIQTISDPGTFSVIVEDENGCINSDTIQIGINELPAPDLGSNIMACTGDTVMLDPGEFIAYEWTTGFKERVLYATDSGSVSVTVTDANACMNSDTVHLGWFPVPAFSLGKDTSIFDYENLLLQADRAFSVYLWSNGDDGSGIQVWGSSTEPGPNTYWMRGTDDNGCQTSDTIIVTINQNTSSIGIIDSPELNIWPNPAEGNVYIRFPNEEAEDYRLYVRGLSGKTCRIMDLVNSSNIVLDIHDLESGIYFIELRGPKTYRARLLIR